MANRNNLLYSRMAIDLRLLNWEIAAPLLETHLEAPESAFQDVLHDVGRFSESDSMRLREAVARLLEAHGGDAASALDSLDAGETLHPDANPTFTPGGTPSGGWPDEQADHAAETLQPEAGQMATLAGPPSRGRDFAAPLTMLDVAADDRYRDPVEFSRGGMGRILVVHDGRMSRSVAMKELLPPGAGARDLTAVPEQSAKASRGLVHRFLREARITGNLEHPSIVPVYELGRRADGSHYYTMKLVRGRTLHEAIREAGTLDERLLLLPHVIDLCQAIAYAHSKGVVHRDIKPSNVMVGSFGETVVIDWGLAKVLGQEDPYAADLETPLADGAPSLTMAGIPVGTPHYMSPEQAEGRVDEIGPRADVYSLGVVLYEVLAGRTPFTGTESNVVLQKVLTDQPPGVLTHAPAIPPDLAAICARAMERNPERRYATALEMAEDLTRFTTGSLVRGYSYSLGELARHFYRRNRALCNTALAAAAVTLAVAGTAYVHIIQANIREREQRAVAEFARGEAEASAYRAGIQLAGNQLESGNVQQAGTILLEQPVAQRHWEWRLLLEQCLLDAATATDHAGEVFRLWPLPDGRIATQGIQERITVRNPVTLEALGSFPTEALPILSAAPSPDGTLLAMARMDGRLVLGNLADFSVAAEARAPGVSFQGVAFSPDGTRVAAGSERRGIFIWDRQARLVGRIEDSAGGAMVLGFTKDGSGVIAQRDFGVTIHTSTNGDVLHTLAGTDAALDRAGARLALRDGTTIRVHDTATGAVLFEHGGPESEQAARGLRLSPDGDRIAVTVPGLGLRLWNVDSGHLLDSWNDREYELVLAFDRQSERVAVASIPHAIHIMAPGLREPVQVLKGHSNPVRSAAFDGGDTMLYSCAGDQEVKAWRIAPLDAAPLEPRDRQNGADVRLSLSQAAGLVGVGSGTGEVSFLDLQSLAPRLTVAAYDRGMPRKVLFSPEGTRAAIQLSIGTVVIITLPDGRIVSRCQGGTGHITDFAWSPDGQTIATGSRDGIHLLDSATGASRGNLGEGRRVSALAYIAGGELVSGHIDGGITIWNPDTGQAVREFSLGVEGVRVLSVAPSGDYAAAILATDTLVYLPLQPGATPRVLATGVSRLAHIQYLEDGKRFTTLSGAEGLTFWDGVRGDRLIAPLISSPPPRSAVLDETYNRLLVASQSGTVTAYSAAPLEISGSPSETAGAIEDYKRRRGDSVRSHEVRVSAIHSLVTPQVLEEGAARLEGLPESDAPYVEPDGNPLVRVGLRPGDRLVRIGDEAHADQRVMARRLKSLATAGGTSPTLPIVLMRDDREITLRADRVEPVIEKTSVTLTRERARELLAGTQTILDNFRPYLTKESQRRSGERGAATAGEMIDSYWIGSPSNAGEARSLTELGLAEGERLLSVNGRPVESIAGMSRWVETALSAMETGTSGSVTALVERDRFLYREVTWTVE